MRIGEPNPLCSAISGGLWTPRKLGAALLYWWDASRLDMISESGGAVSGWTDLVQGCTASQATGASKPIYSATSFGGRAGITFDGTDDELTAAAGLGALPTGATPGEMWAVVSQDALASDGAGARMIAAFGNASSVTRSLRRAVLTSTNRFQAASGDGTGSVTSNMSGAVFEGRHVVRGMAEAALIKSELDGVQGTATACVSATVATRLRLGASAVTTPGSFWQGVIHAVLITSPLQAAQATQLRAYLSRRL